METCRTVADIRRVLEPCRRAGSIVGLVPTMGALHAGHLALFGEARRDCHVVVASLFVNPTQFDEPADLARYPRDEERDARAAARAGVDVLFAPAVLEMYPAGFATSVDVGGPALGFEADFRPGHFRGVATVCLKLFTIVRPQVACFGQKDAQQAAVIRRLVRDLHLEIEIRIVPTVREADGLALSSRNAQLSPSERVRACAIARALEVGLAAHRGGGDPVSAARAALVREGGIDPDYVAVADFEGEPTLAIAARVGQTRLIDNVRLD